MGVLVFPPPQISMLLSARRTHSVRGNIASKNVAERRRSNIEIGGRGSAMLAQDRIEAFLQFCVRGNLLAIFPPSTVEPETVLKFMASRIYLLPHVSWRACEGTIAL